MQDLNDVRSIEFRKASLNDLIEADRIVRAAPLHRFYPNERDALIKWLSEEFHRRNRDEESRKA